MSVATGSNRFFSTCAILSASAVICGLLSRFYSKNFSDYPRAPSSGFLKVMGDSANRSLDLDVTWPKVVLFGDSLTEYSFSTDGQWGAILADRLQRKCDVVPRGFRGYNTRMCKAVLPAVFRSFGEPIAAVTIFLGANDANSKDRNPQQHVPLDEYKENLVGIVKLLEERGVHRSKIIFIAPPAFDGPTWAKFRQIPEPTKDNDTTRIYAKACVEVAESLGIDNVNFFHIMETQFAGTWKELLNDGLHLSVKGSKALVDAVWPLIEKRVEKFPEILPAWDSMDAENPDATISSWVSSHQK